MLEMKRNIKKLLCLDERRERIKKLYRDVFGTLAKADEFIDQYPDAEEILTICLVRR